MRNYTELLGLPYILGKQDCYGLVRSYYQRNYGLQMENYARPFGFGNGGLDLISSNLSAEGFVPVDVNLSKLELGDGIVMAITGSYLANHVGVYVGNNLFIHHLYNQRSLEEDFSPNWRRRVLTIVRNPRVTQKNNEDPINIVNMSELLPPHVRAQLLK